MGVQGGHETPTLELQGICTILCALVLQHVVQPLVPMNARSMQAIHIKLRKVERFFSVYNAELTQAKKGKHKKFLW